MNFFIRIPKLLSSNERRRDQCLVGVGDKKGVFALMDSSGLVRLVSPSGIRLVKSVSKISVK